MQVIDIPGPGYIGEWEILLANGTIIRSNREPRDDGSGLDVSINGEYLVLAPGAWLAYRMAKDKGDKSGQ